MRSPITAKTNLRPSASVCRLPSCRLVEVDARPSVVVVDVTEDHPPILQAASVPVVPTGSAKLCWHVDGAVLVQGQHGQRDGYADLRRKPSALAPVHLSIPIIGVSVPLSVLTLNRNGTVNVPTNFAEPGWYNGDRSPGQKGSAVILGHVDNYHGPAVFFNLDQLQLGNRVDVTLADGRKLVFAVIGERMYKKTNFPDALVYGARNYPALQLVTCGGIFDPKTGHYLSNIVVFTALIKS